MRLQDILASGGFNMEVVARLTERDADTSGTSREVWLFGDFVIKRSFGEPYCNVLEGRIWKKREQLSLDGYLAEVYAYDDRNGAYIVMERCDVPKVDTYTASEAVESLVSATYDVGMSDIWFGNIGVNQDGDWVIIDYGYVNDKLSAAVGVKYENGRTTWS